MKIPKKYLAHALVRDTKMTFKQKGDGVFSCCLKYKGRQVTLTEYDVPKGQQPQLRDVLLNLASMAERGFNVLNVGSYMLSYGHNHKLYSTVENEFAEVQRLKKGLCRVYGKQAHIVYFCFGLPVPPNFTIKSIF